MQVGIAYERYRTIIYKKRQESVYDVWKPMKKLFYANLTIYFLNSSVYVLPLTISRDNEQKKSRLLYGGPVECLFYTSSVIIIIEIIEIET